MFLQALTLLFACTPQYGHASLKSTTVLLGAGHMNDQQKICVMRRPGLLILFPLMTLIVASLQDTQQGRNALPAFEDASTPVACHICMYAGIAGILPRQLQMHTGLDLSSTRLTGICVKGKRPSREAQHSMGTQNMMQDSQLSSCQVILTFHSNKLCGMTLQVVCMPSSLHSS